MAQVWAVNALGGYMFSENLSNVLRMVVLPTVKFRQFCDAKDGTKLGLNRGDTFSWNVYSRVATGGTALNESQEMPATNFVITQSSLTVTEYGNSVPYSGKLDNLSKHPVVEIIHKVLKIDCVETLDGAAHAQFDATPLLVGPTAASNQNSVTFEDTTSTITNGVAYGIGHAKVIVDGLKERNIPPYTGDDYYAIGWPTTFRTLKGTATTTSTTPNGLEAIYQYTETGFRHIMNGEVGRYNNVRYIEQTHVAKGGAQDSLTWTFRTADPWNGGLSDWIFFLGEDTVAEAIVIPEEIRGRIPTDFGRSRGVAWYYLGGFGLVHTVYAQARVAKWESAA